jgi:phosphoribosylamine--glycine ligase
MIFHAGTAVRDGRLVTSGGRVLCATALGSSVRDAASRAYYLASQVNWQGMFFRRDIGYRAVAREEGRDAAAGSL